MKVAWIVIAFSMCIPAWSQVKTRSYLIDPKRAPREHNVDFLHLKLELSFDPASGLVKGKVTHRFTPLQKEVDSIVLDAVNIRVKEILLNGKPVKYKNDSTSITVFPSEKLSWRSTDSLIITYEATPQKGLYFIGWNDPENISRKQIWSQGQGTDNRCWIPMYDEMNDKLVTELIVRFDKEYKVLSNGTFLGSKENKDGTLTWHYSMTHPHSPYLIMLGIGKYDIKETKSKSGIPLHLYYYPEWKDRVESTYQYSEQMVDFYEKEIGVPYGWESYSQLPVQDFMFGAMENTTATVFGDFFFVDPRSKLDRSYVGVNAHELAHQWFGDLVTANSDAHHWLQESFATYYDQLFERAYLGDDTFDWSRRNSQNAALEESKKNSFPVAHSEGGTVRHYPKGAFVLNMLKYICGGREAYNQAIRYYLQKHRYENVDSEDLLKAFEETLGYSLDWFWEEWIYKGGEPAYTITFQELDKSSQFIVQQSQELTSITGLPVQGNQSVAATNDPFVSANSIENRPAGLFKMPIWFEVHYADGTMERKQVMIQKQTELVSVPNPDHKKIAYVLFDPDNNVLKSVIFNKPFEMLEAQALNAPYMLDRYDALLAMKSLSLERKREVLIKVFKKESFQACKAEVVEQLANDNNPQSMELIRSAFGDKDVMVRKAALKEFHGSIVYQPEVESLLTDSSYEIVASALEKLCYYNTDKISRYLETTKNTEGTSGRNVKITWLEIAYNHSSDKQYADQLVAYSGNAYEFRTRANAMGALRGLNYFDRKLELNCIDAIFSGNTRLSGPASETLNFFIAQDKYKKSISDDIHSGTWSILQRKKLEPFIPKI